jgi:hypothetical protein
VERHREVDREICGIVLQSRRELCERRYDMADVWLLRRRTRSSIDAGAVEVQVDAAA